MDRFMTEASVHNGHVEIKNLPFADDVAVQVIMFPQKDTLQTTEHCYIVKDSNILSGEPIIQGTRTPVRAIIETWRLGVSPEEMPKGLPHLTLAQIFDALSYYSDHQDEINAYIEANRIPEDLIDPRVKNL